MSDAGGPTCRANAAITDDFPNADREATRIFAGKHVGRC
ncbi:hypothetical protein FHW23_000119 [Curtobacterium pusillum]|uniref:Uncharacterized protein n=1 Tax=Curtobacterium pusillum TaxID=69373 RepID=A0AAW3T300_9MICO|nr:hypothetical protein [Curtobacterium pusillum]